MSGDAHAAVDVLFAGGGSGGHLFPGLAVAAALAKLRPEWQLHFVGSDRAVEQRIMHGQPWPHTPLSVMPPANLLRRPLSFASSNWKAFTAVKRFWATRSPKVVVGLGGFASVPAMWVASRRKTPMVLLEQNAIPGRATRWFAKQAAAVCLGFEEAAAELPSAVKTIATGNPVREEVAALAQTVRKFDAKSLLVLGGSQGASGLNQALAAWVTSRPDDLRGWHVLHQAGPHDVEELSRVYATAGVSVRVEDFIADMATVYRVSHRVIARAGATTLSELACAGIPAVLVPFPQAVDDHQRRNAQHFVQAGAAVCVTQQDVPQATAALLARAWETISNDPAQFATMAAAMKQRSRPHAAEDVARVILDLADRVTA